MVVFSRKYCFSQASVIPRTPVSKARVPADSYAVMASGYGANLPV
ncbi:hypothetical protein [Bradyrhizobium sp. Tv2a-2]|nr:hypothetical protein [Bradyrhizobium sp. Tv2a-2]